MTDEREQAYREFILALVGQKRLDEFDRIVLGKPTLSLASADGKSENEAK